MAGNNIRVSRQVDLFVMWYLISFTCFILSILFFKIGWFILCVARGQKKALQLANDIKYTIDDYYAMGNPFNGFNGFTNF